MIVLETELVEFLYQHTSSFESLLDTLRAPRRRQT